MNKYNNGFGEPEKKVNPLKVLGIIWLILVVVGVVIYARNYDYYYNKYKAFNNHELTTETTEEEKPEGEETEEDSSEEENKEQE